MGSSSVCNNNQSALTESVDSFDMVRGLSASQEYTNWDWFITFICNHSKNPEVNFLHKWKKSEEWASQLDRYHTMPQFMKEEYKYAMEEASGPTVLRNWIEVRTLVLQWLTKHLTFLGDCGTIFSRDEYQPKSGNVFHEHLVYANKKSTMNDKTRQVMLDMLRTSVFEVIKTKDMQPLIDKGLFSSNSDYFDKIELAGTFLPHMCNARCKRRIAPGDGPESFVCRKLHAVKDSPDPARHQFIEMKFQFSQSCIKALERCGLCKVVSEYETEFHHAYFCSSRHIAPCNYNTTCNMSPVLTELFLLFLSMVNAQLIGHANGIAKYILKYVGKFDEGTRVIASANAHTGAVKVGSQFLHNTKITSSRMNEDKAFNQSRDKHLPHTRAMAILEMFQQMVASGDVTTNLHFIPVSTLPFEVRSRQKIKLNSRGRLIRNDNDDANDNNNPSADAHVSGVAAKRARESEELELHPRQQLTPSQEMTARDHKGSSRKYDMMSIFGLRPPELVSVFDNPKYYFGFLFH